MKTLPAKMIYNIYAARSGELLISRILLDRTEIEQLSEDTTEGFFRADCADGLESLGDRSVYATLSN